MHFFPHSWRSRREKALHEADVKLAKVALAGWKIVPERGFYGDGGEVTKYYLFDPDGLEHGFNLDKVKCAEYALLQLDGQRTGPLMSDRPQDRRLQELYPQNERKPHWWDTPLAR